MDWSDDHLRKLKAEGKISGYKVTKLEKPKRPFVKGEGFKIKGVNRKGKGAKEKAWIDKNLWAWCQEKKLKMRVEWVFHEERRWRFDWSINSIKVAVEYEGVFSEKSGHTTAKGYTGDTEKYNAAQALGWKVFRFTAMNFMNLLTELNNYIMNHPTDKMEMPCLCDCGEWFDQSEGHATVKWGSNKIVCTECHANEVQIVFEIERLESEIDDLELQGKKPKTRERLKKKIEQLRDQL